MNPNPAKRARRSSSPGSPSVTLPQSGSARALGSTSTQGTAPALSPSQPFLPPPHALAHPPSHSHSLSHPVLPLPRASNLMSPKQPGSAWSSAWPTANSSHAGESDNRGLGIAGLTPHDGPPRTGVSSRSGRRSVDPLSPSSPGSPLDAEDQGQSTEGGLVFTRDTSSRAPRSMMACTRCRRQKMKCDGPGVQPCRGCRQSGSQCVFEARSRPKSLSVLPGRAPPFFPARPPTPTVSTPLGSGASGFYPTGAQPAPPTLSRGGMTEPYALRTAREPMPPPPATSLSALTAPYPLQPPPARAPSPPHPMPPPGPAHTGHTRHGSMGQSAIYHPPPSATGIPPPFSAGRPLSPSRDIDARLRNVESSVRSLASVPNALLHLQLSINTLNSHVDQLSTTLSGPSSVEVSEVTWEDYRSRAWPLTPWLVGLRESNGLQGLVVDYLGKRSTVDRREGGRQLVESAFRKVKKEIGRLAAQSGQWTREDVRALGVFAAWTGDTPLVGLAVSHARMLGLDRIWSSRKTNDDWREWIYLSIMDRLSHVVDQISPISTEPLAAGWRDRLAGPNGAHPDPAVRDRDHKLLAWLEYAEMLTEVHKSQQLLRRDLIREDIGSMDVRAAEGMIEIWRRYSSRWEAWAGAWSARTDPILSLHFNYAVVYTASPLFLARDGVWELLARESEGRAVLERARDAAFAVLSAVCSPDVGRTIVYSYSLFRPILAASLILLLNLDSLPHTSPPLISHSHVSDVARTTLEMVSKPRSLDWDSSGGMLSEIEERGEGRVGGEAGAELWKLFMG